MTSHLITEQGCFSDLHPLFSLSEAASEADRCYFCFDAPCTKACPTDIDVPAFIQKIRSDNITGSARTILSENIMGAMCARVCPTENLCEQACVRNTQQDKTVEIGALQRFATEAVVANQQQLFVRGLSSGKQIAIVGAGPAGLSCAHRLSMFGHSVTILEAKDKLAGLNEYGIAAYKATDNIAAREAEYILAIGGIDVKTNMSLGRDFTLADLREQYDAVLLSPGLGDTRQLGIDGEDSKSVLDAVDYIADLRQAKPNLPVANNVVVIGGGMTAIDVAVQSKLLGAQEVTIVYRRGKGQMAASLHEQELAQTHGIQIRHYLSPKKIIHGGDGIRAVEFETMLNDEDGSSNDDHAIITLPADLVFKAIGQLLVTEHLNELTLEAGRIVVDESRRTSLKGVWAGGDCVSGGDNLTVSAVQDGKLAAISINQMFDEEAA